MDTLQVFEITEGNDENSDEDGESQDTEDQTTSGTD
jgi:hypothetical protein